MRDGKGIKLLKNTLASLVIPVSMFLILQLICMTKGMSLITVDNYKTLIVNTFYLAFIAAGLYFNVPSGRFDFSIGAILVLSSVIGGNIALNLGLGAVGLLACCLLCGAVLGMISGFAYVFFGLPAMVVSLGVALIFEAFTFILFDAKGVVMIGKDEMLTLIKLPNIFVLGAIVFAALAVIVNLTKFGYNYKALAYGQQISVNTGINEKVNAVICYTISGTLAAAAGVLTLSRTGSASASLGLATIPTMFSGLLPMFIGGIIAKYSEAITGVFLGALTAALLSTGFASLKISLSAQNIVSAFILLGFLIYSMNQHRFREFALIRKRKIAAELNQGINS